MKLKDINTLLKSFDIEPLLEYKESDPNEKMMYGLARMWTEEGFREYLKHAINVAMRNAVTCADDDVSHSFYKSRALTLKELLSKSEWAFKKESERRARLKVATNTTVMVR